MALRTEKRRISQHFMGIERDGYPPSPVDAMSLDNTAPGQHDVCTAMAVNNIGRSSGIGNAHHDAVLGNHLSGIKNHEAWRGSVSNAGRRGSHRVARPRLNEEELLLSSKEKIIWEKNLIITRQRRKIRQLEERIQEMNRLYLADQMQALVVDVGKYTPRLLEGRLILVPLIGHCGPEYDSEEGKQIAHSTWREGQQQLGPAAENLIHRWFIRKQLPPREIEWTHRLSKMSAIVWGVQYEAKLKQKSSPNLHHGLLTEDPSDHRHWSPKSASSRKRRATGSRSYMRARAEALWTKLKRSKYLNTRNNLSREVLVAMVVSQQSEIRCLQNRLSFLDHLWNGTRQRLEKIFHERDLSDKWSV
ncbi:hypothetical protein BKA70DRAFT_1220471 [Coprinopsis sp. MPI-PUGE-AT-0042]|nr:hypothetical protein BKA70DRAFT_1220471 [Coprinopsis sp. MPI-PUGE-AT-0042]